MPRMKKPRSQRPILRKNDDLPDEIVFQIVERLPVKSLLRSRCVCKSWYSYITNPTFISKRYLNNHDGEDDDDFILHMRSSEHSISRFSEKVCTVSSDRTFEKISEIGIPFFSECANLVGSCNGLLCLSDIKNVYLWNLSIRKFKKLPDSDYTSSEILYRVVGFGYDSQNNDYKVVRINCTPYRPVIEVYTLRLDSWKIVELGISWRPNVVGYKFCNDSPYPLVSGHLHWRVYIKQGGGQAGPVFWDFKMILSFDVNSEKFKELPMPGDRSFEKKEYIGRILTSFKGKLALTVKGEPNGLSICIWVMREYGVHESWNKLFVVSFENTVFAELNEIWTRFIDFTKNGLFLIQKQYCEKKKRSHWREKCVLIDPETLHEKDTTIKAEDCIIMVSYMENLALLDAANVESY